MTGPAVTPRNAARAVPGFADSVRVVQSTVTWLPRTQFWLYQQISYLPDSITSRVICDDIRNGDSFSVRDLHSLRDASRARYLWERRISRLAIRRRTGFLRKHVREWNADVVHSHFADRAWWDLPAGRATGARHVVSFYGFDVHQLPAKRKRWRSRYRELFAEGDLVLCEGPHMANSIISLGCPEGKLRVHRLGVAVDDIAFQPRNWAAGEPLRILIAASFREKKGIPYAVEAIGRIQSEVPVEVTIIGDAGGDSESRREKENILTTIARHNLSGKVRMLGFQPFPVVLEEAYRHHIFLAPSITARDGDCEGGAPVSIIQMAASGMMVVSTRHCDIPEVVSHGQTGWLASERNVDDLVGILRRLIEDRGGWRIMLERSRRHIEARFDVRRQSDRLALMYSELANQ